MIPFLRIAAVALVPVLREAQEKPDACPQVYSANAMVRSSKGAGVLALGFGGLTVYTCWV